jgi:hypothetical protein
MMKANSTRVCPWFDLDHLAIIFRFIAFFPLYWAKRSAVGHYLGLAWVGGIPVSQKAIIKSRPLNEP